MMITRYCIPFQIRSNANLFESGRYDKFEPDDEQSGGNCFLDSSIAGRAVLAQKHVEMSVNRMI